jgi:thymidylate synthase
MITDRLKEGLHGSNTNSMVAQVFQLEDLERACVARPNSSGMACVTQLQFHPRGDKLHLYQTLRSQYIDLKGYGNLVSAATLLTKVCAQTGYLPGSIIEHVHNVTEYRQHHRKNLYELSHETKRATSN